MTELVIFKASELESNQQRQDSEFERIEHSLALEQQVKRIKSIQSRFGVLEKQVHLTLNIQLLC